MICNIYRSDTKAGLYVYLAEDQEITDLPDELIKLIGHHTHAMELNLNSCEKLANEDIKTVKANLKEQGYHVQLPKTLVESVLSYKA